MRTTFWAHWLNRSTIALARPLAGDDTAALTYTLHWSYDGDIEVAGSVSGAPFPLTFDGDLSAELQQRHPHVADFVALTLPDSAIVRADQLLRGQILVSVSHGSNVRAVTGVQIPGVVDDLYAEKLRDVKLGPVWDGDRLTLRVWAPTARKVGLVLADQLSIDPIPAERTDDGVWTVRGDRSWEDARYLWKVECFIPRESRFIDQEVTDPYSLGLDLRSKWSIAVDLQNRRWVPDQWATTPSPIITNQSSRAIWELHVRDFSIHDPSVPEEQRGTYKAFTNPGSLGMRHLAELVDAGIDTIHLLPTFDLATVEADRRLHSVPKIPADAGPASHLQQEAISKVEDWDGFNWGYDPFHYSTPEGSYATEGNQEGGARSREFREMVGALHAAGLHVVLDKVFNHTTESGQNRKSVLDRIVPGYYHRLSPGGCVETSTCCQNVATEHAAAEKLMVDSVVMWAKQYHVDGFRFDLMGHHSRANMERIRAALDELTLERDGVDGKAIYLYGEGWNFGEVADNARFYQATQGQLDGTGIGCFNDRIRDAVHGGRPFDADNRVNQGFGTGLFTDPNEVAALSKRKQRTQLLQLTDLVRLSMAGNLRDFEFVTSDGTVKRGDEESYGGEPAGYATSPEETVNYVDAHDNETLYDLNVMKLPVGTSMADRVRMNTVQLATVTLGQAPSFWHAGTEILRSKSLDRDSYDAGDHFNALDWTLQRNTFGSGLPAKKRNEQHWPVMAPLLANEALRPDEAAMRTAKAMALDLLRLRRSTPLLTLGSAQLIRDRVSFPGSGPDAVPGLLLMWIADGAGADDLDPNLDGVLVAINASPAPVTTAIPELAGLRLELSPIQARGEDEAVRSTTWADGALTVPARTAAVLVAPAVG